MHSSRKFLLAISNSCFLWSTVKEREHLNLCSVTLSFYHLCSLLPSPYLKQNFTSFLSHLCNPAFISEFLPSEFSFHPLLVCACHASKNILPLPIKTNRAVTSLTISDVSLQAQPAKHLTEG